MNAYRSGKPMIRRSLRLLLTVMAALTIGAGWRHDTAFAQPAEPFFAGKTVRILIGFDVGGQYGQFARLAATHIRAHVPGNPTITVQSMPGASGMTAMSYMTGPATPQDGTVLSIVTLGVLQETLLEPQTKFDARRLKWIGRMQTVMQIGLASTSSGIGSIADAKARPFVAGGVGANSLPTMNFRLLNELAGTQFKIITGYKGTAEMHLAMERGEINAYNNAWDFVENRYLADVKSGRFSIIYVNSLGRVPELASVPNIADFARTDVEKAFMRIYSAGTEFGRSLVASAGVPDDRMAIWRVAFAKMVSDPAFRADAAGQSIRLEPMDHVKLTDFATSVLTMPPDTIAAARAFYARLLGDTK